VKRSLPAQIAILAFIRTIFNTMIRMVYPFLPVFARGLGVELWQLSLAFTLRSSVGIVGPLFASISDSKGRRAGMLLGAALFTLGAAMMVIWPSYGAFALALIFSLGGNIVFIPSFQAYVGDHVPYRRRGLALAASEFSWSLSFILGIPLMGLMIQKWGWQAPFPLLALGGLFALATLAMLIPAGKPAGGHNAGLQANFKKVLSYPPALAGLGLGIAISGGNELINLVFGVWMEDAFQVNISTLAIASSIIGFSELAAEGLVTVLSDRLGKARAVRIGLLGSLLATCSLPWLGTDLQGALIGLSLIYLTFEFVIVSSIPLMTEVLPEARATLMAGFIAATAIGRALGAAASPWLYSFGSSGSNFGSILPVAIGSALLNLAALGALRLVQEKRLPDNI